MTFSRNTLIALGTASVMGLFSSCDLLGGVYDDTLDHADEAERQETSATQQTEEVVTTDEEGNDVVIQVISGQLYVNATSYTQWTYVSLHGEAPTTATSDISLADMSETGAPDEWDFALHRYDVKTHGAEVLMTDFHSIAELEATGLPAEGTWVADTYADESVTVDMSHMLEGYLIYAPGYKNTEAGRWLDVDTSTMPPIYTMHDNVMLYRFSDGTYAAVQLTNFMSTDRYQTKGWMTVNYKYPVFRKR